MFRIAGLLVLGMSGILPAAPLEIGRTPVLGATLPNATTWQVEQQQAGGAWAGTGVLVGGAGLPVSVRMDGFPAGASYRFQRVAGAVTTLVPVVGTGWHLAGQEVGAGQVQIERSAELAAWGHEALVFPGADGRYVRALREPLGARGFFRARVPELPTGDASVSSHSTLPNNQGAAGFGPIFDDMPQIFKDGFIGALSPAEYHRGGENAAAAGECYELAGPFGRVTVMITDLTDAPPGTVDVGRSFFDLGQTAYPPLSGGAVTGALTAGVRLVPAPVTGNVKLYVPAAGTSIYYMELRPYNYRAGINKVEIQNNGSTTWVNMPRSQFNSFVFLAGGTPLAFPVKVRVSSRFGEVVTFPSIPALADGQKITGPAQFTVFPELAPVPQHRVRPMYRDALTKVPGDQWSAGGYGGATVTEVDPAVAYAGTASLRLSGLGGYAGVTFSQYPAFPRPEFGVLKLAIRSAAPVAADQVGLLVYGVNVPGGPQVNSAVIQLPPLTTTWQVFQVPLVASGAPATIFGMSLFGRVPGALPNVWIDEVEILNY